MIETKNVWKTYQMGEVKVHAVKGISFKVKEGDFIFITGPSGSGKTTLLDILGALSRPTKGKVLLNGKDLNKFDDFQLSMFRRKRIGFVFQTFNLIPSLNCLDNVLIPVMPDGVTDKERNKAVELLEKVGLGNRINHTPNELSGGERQRVAIARSLINDPQIIFADEPTGNLDTKTGQEVFNYLREINKKKNKTIVVVTHDLEYIKKKDKVFKLKDGKLLKR